MKESLLGNEVVSGKKKKAVVIFCKRKISFSDDCLYINPPNVY